MSHRVGARVRVADRPYVGHHRTPSYVKGRTGTIERVDAEYANPESLAYGGDGRPPVRLYRVGFAADEVWASYRGSASDRIVVDLYEHWLEPTT